MWQESWIVAEACHNCAVLNFDHCNSQDLKCLCGDKDFLATVASCISENIDLPEDQYTAWDRFAMATCEIHNAGIQDQDYVDAIKFLNHTGMETLPSSNSHGKRESWVKTPPVYKPIKISEHQFNLTYSAVHNFLYEKDISVWQGSFLVFWWILVVAISSFAHFLRYLNVRFASTSVAMQRPNVIYRWYQKNILIPACFGGRHMTRVQILGLKFTIPTRFETIVIGVYFVLNVVFVCAPYTLLEYNPLYPTHWKAFMRYISDRTGIIAVIQMPLLVLFALKNNILITLTGWSFSTFNTYHRAVSRVTFMQLIVHAITKHVFSASYGASLVKYFYPLPYYRWGVSAIFLMVIMILTAMVRSKYYEVFLRLHILCGIGAFICSLYHLNGLGYKQTVYVSFGLWAADWLIRLGRLIFLNISLLFSGSGSKGTFAQINVLNGDVANVRVKTSVLWKPKPGQYVYIYVSKLKFWEAHPFSVVGPSIDGESFQLFCKARGGLTKHLCQNLTESGCNESTAMTKSVMIEGPYGVHAPVERYQNILLVAGGVGITGVLPYVEYLVKLQESNEIAENVEIHFVWIIQGTPDISWVADRMKQLTSSSKLKISIFARLTGQETFSSAYSSSQTSAQTLTTLPSSTPITQVDSPLARVERAYKRLEESSHSSEDMRVLSNLDEKKEEAINSSAMSIRTCDYVDLEKYITLGRRPQLESIIGTFFAESTGAACVLGCGPPTMMDGLRSSVVNHIDLVQYGRTDYFEEAFSW